MEQVEDRRLERHGHVTRIEEHYVGWRAMEMEALRRRKRGRPKRRWLDSEG